MIAEARDMDRRYAALASFADAPPETIRETHSQPVTSTRSRSAKRAGAEMRAQWVSHVKGLGINLQGRGKRYMTPSQATVGLAPANELPGKPNRWFSGLADEPTDVVVLLCRSSTGRLYDLVVPISGLGRRWDLLSRSGGQIKFNIRKDISDFLLLIPGNEPLRVTQYMGNYEPLRGNGAG
jgi:hypothetical protein